MTATEDGAKTPTGSTPTPNASSPPTVNAGPRKWGAASRPEDWVTVRSLVGKRFGLTRITHAVIVPEKGENAGRARPSFVLEMDDGHLFSVNETDSIGGQLRGMGIPPVGAGHTYTVEAQPSTKSRTGDALLLREV